MILKNRKVFPILLILVNTAFAQPGQVWQQLYDHEHSRNDVFTDIYKASNGDYLLCGQSASNPWVVRVDAEGRTLWDFNAIGNRFYSLIEADNGDIVVVGQTTDENFFGAIRLNADGELIWERQYGSGRAHAVLELKSGDFISCGTIAGSRNGFVVRFNEAGNPIWSRQYGTNQYPTILMSMRETEGGIVYAGESPNRGWVLKTDFDGNEIWSQTYQDAVFSIVSSTGGFALGCHTYNDDYDYVLTRIDGTGEVISRTIIDMPANGGWLESMNKLSDGGFAFVGSTSDERNSRQYPLLIRVDENADVLWTKNWQNEVDQQPGGIENNIFNQLYGVIDKGIDEIVVCGSMYNTENRQYGDGFIAEFSSDSPGPRIFYMFPEDSLLTVLLGDSIEFIVLAGGRAGEVPQYQWFFEEQLIGISNDSITIFFNEYGQHTVNCNVELDSIVVTVTWHVIVTDLFISAFTPETLDLAIRRGTSVDFSLDTIRFTDGSDPEILWTKTNLSNGQTENAGTESRATIDFPWSGEYSVEGRVIRGESSDAVTWHVDVSGAIWAYVPLTDSLKVLPDSVVHFEVVPTLPEDERLEVTWLVDGELVREGELGLDWAFGGAGGEADSCPPYHVQCVVADSVETDTVQWVVTVNDLGIGDIKEVGQAEMPILLSVSPNPFNSMLTIRYSTSPINREATLRVYDIAGREVFSVVAAPNLSGKITPPLNQQNKSNPFATPYYGVAPTIVGGDSQTLVWDAPAQPAGVYFVRLQSGGSVSTKKVVLMR